ncbi:hypothetical protein SLEP1_g33357 [Rubroshorea leprosula]|uniref:Laccase n=1 Tax=Rubroshorea leprosula TaxID=152421 RepID=A0AAV5KGF4_9ROSI|nr:hypothetical protein SLEP1_g33357 [Rubroshorea leprosula]
MGGSYVQQLHSSKFLVVMLLMSASLLPSCSSQTTRRFQFNIEQKEVSRLCHRKALLTVNGEYPGPTIAVQEGDNVEVKVTNRISQNTTIHWHGIRQIRTGWADGPAFITQCPIRTGQSYTYKFTVINQKGTLLWHAHHLWQRASIYGAFIIYPRLPYPFSVPIQAEVPIILGEWWNAEVDAVENEMMMYGGGPNASNAYTINGLPGPLYPCSIKDTFIQPVEHGKTYMLRIINAALNNELFFAVANHSLTVVEVDAVYTKPFETTAIMIAPGQTTTVLITANQDPNSSGMFAMASRPYLTTLFPSDKSIAVGFLRYKGTRNGKMELPTRLETLQLDNLPQLEDNDAAIKFSKSLKSLASPQYPCQVPKKIDKRIMTTISLNLQDCPANKTCKGLNGGRFLASMNNQSFVHPKMSILQSYYYNLTAGVFASNFPEQPPKSFNYTGVDPLTEDMSTETATKLFTVPYGARIEIVLQDTNFLNPENHPIHVHGHNFFIVGSGFGNFDIARDPARYNLIDPPERNTVAVPKGGWAAIRIKADNPGVWYIHCHLEEHTSWGLATGFIVQNGPIPSQTLLPPPEDLPLC